MTRLAILLVAILLVAFAAVGLAAGRDDAPKLEGYTDPVISAEEKSHWSFLPPVRPEIPAVKNQKWVRNPVDAFILAKLETAGMTPAPEADRLTLIRRVTLDLTGLPPTPEEVDAFLKDTRPDAYERLVDRLLASPHYGERWATHWLDIVRFAESNGYELDAERAQAWRYRDYVIRSFNADKPYDVFLTEQIAGDELAAGKDPRNCADLLIATGLHRCGPVHVVGGNLDKAMVRQEVLTEMVNGLGSAVLGLTLGCARCHDHKFDPISAGDYYRIEAFFAPAEYTEVDLATAEEKQERKKKVDALEAKMAPLKKQVAAIDAPVRKLVEEAKREGLEPQFREALAVPANKRTPEQKKLAEDSKRLVKVSWDEILAAMSPEDRARRAAIREKIHAIEAQIPPPPAAAWAIKTEDSDTKSFVLKRGDIKRRAAIALPAYPRVLASAEAKPKSRLELAKWLTRPDHPLTARVMVNRLWQHHFGEGIVATPNDFGARGELPTHPKLLDWLAVEFADGWSLKKVHRLIVLSATYRQASAVAPLSKDPDNKLLGRMNRRRLEAEAIRDSVLAAAGTLNPQVGGPSIKVPLEPEVYDLIFTEGEPDGLWPVTPDAGQHTRRSVYLFSKRNVRIPLFEAFDQPDTLTSCADRPVSTFAPQALILMNGPFTQEQGKKLAVKLVGEVGTDPAKQIEGLYRRAVGRKPMAEEKKLAIEFLKAQAATIRERQKTEQPIGLDAGDVPPGADVAEVRSLADLCVAIFNTNEFVYIP
jgi:hypothetical protein